MIQRYPDQIGSGPLGGLDSGSLASVRWDDISGQLLSARLNSPSGRVVTDYFNSAVNFKNNAVYPDDFAVFSIQMHHRCLIGAGAVLRPHFHWYQTQNDYPNMILGYKFINWGAATSIETDWSGYTLLIPDSDGYIYPGSGTFGQITRFPEVDSSSLTISATVNFVLFRDNANDSGLFSGSDPISGDALISYNDSHIKNDSAGSRQEVIK